MNYRVSTALVIVALVVAGCTNKQETTRQQVIGDWIVEGAPTQHFSLADGGAYQEADALTSDNSSGTWSVSETGGIALVNAAAGITYSAVEQGKTLLLTQPNGAQVTLARPADFYPTVPALQTNDLATMLFEKFAHQCQMNVIYSIGTANYAQGTATPEQVISFNDRLQTALNRNYARTTVPGNPYLEPQEYHYQVTGALQSDGYANVQLYYASDPTGKAIDPLGAVTINYCYSYVPSADFGAVAVKDVSPVLKQVTYSWKSVPAPMTAAMGINVALPPSQPSYLATAVYRGSSWQIAADSGQTQ